VTCNDIRYPRHAKSRHGDTAAQRYLQSPTFPERQPRHSRDRSIFDSYKAMLLAGWNNGCRNGLHLFRTIRRHGFRGQYGIVALYVRRMR
jgi:hypothetical protein